MGTRLVRVGLAARRLILCLVSPYYFPYAPQISRVIVRLHRGRLSKCPEISGVSLRETATVTFCACCNQL